MLFSAVQINLMAHLAGGRPCWPSWQRWISSATSPHARSRIRLTKSCQADCDATWGSPWWDRPNATLAIKAFRDKLLYFDQFWNTHISRKNTDWQKHERVSHGSKTFSSQWRHHVMAVWWSRVSHVLIEINTRRQINPPA